MSAPPFRKVLVANRGEIARRVFRTCRAHGIATVAVWSEADRGAPHVLDADEAYCIGAPPARDSYLVGERIIEVALRSGAEAIHPGYGFLSERASFAAACEAAGVVFVGPPGAAMDVMGDKVAARRAMIEAKVPVVPGVEDVQDVAAARSAAAEIGYPVMVKASAGGGGKGMRVVHDPAKLERAFEAAAREAMASFGDDRIFIERAVMRARHVEIQLMADAHGNVVYLGERDCSVQRRHQKVIEESPSPSAQMSARVRAAMGEVAVRAARAVGYRSAGTVEFLFEETDDGPRFYFLEMNTRLQVEHPVTEAITGRDLVLDQLRVAAGEPLGYAQEDVELRGHAIECRIYAEDPSTFLPRPGPVHRVRWPQGAGVRIDAAVDDRSEVSSYYDPMIAKLTTWGPDRPAALARMRAALRDTVLLGIPTNIPLHLRILGEPDFVDGRSVSTRYLDLHPELMEPRVMPDDDPRRLAVAAAAAVRAATNSRPAAAEAGTVDEGRAWRESARWRG
ncbi:acetyl-CoA carboxylase biotin carboxylase subunit [Paraliomyxa miuraensis]|uniref:acetyl-CoA carboxylase biotin carboxylase subunit n=1 Tax=Paraliomyxa miuraensis TaxID=376150 RepID=UPI00224E4D43|nr:acetyl-CoA carboxylase biotin carboxylase subunit [Paraliomyxa miuraensis]MCX4245452.1 acetyl-CoA carboxylase biotin carboxylase subunit [Paraliomyxa miuraensis]